MTYDEKVPEPRKLAKFSNFYFSFAEILPSIKFSRNFTYFLITLIKKNIYILNILNNIVELSCLICNFYLKTIIYNKKKKLINTLGLYFFFLFLIKNVSSL